MGEKRRTTAVKAREGGAFTLVAWKKAAGVPGPRLAASIPK
jgi:hypothetical protein